MSEVYVVPRWTTTGATYFNVKSTFTLGGPIIIGELRRCVNDWSFYPVDKEEIALYELKEIVNFIEHLNKLTTKE